MTDHTIVRDYWDRPYVTTDGGPLRYADGRKTPVNAVAYSRISKLAGVIDDASNLKDWFAARVAVGLATSKSLSARVAHLADAFDDPWDAPEGKKPLKQLVQTAAERGGASEAADLGTAFHGYTESIDRGIAVKNIPADFDPWLRAWHDAMRDWEPLYIEPFVVCDQLQVAGSPDRYLRHRDTGRVVCADIKTGSHEPNYPLKVTTQVAVGSRSVLYDQATGSRTLIDCDQDVGLLIHVPIRSGEPRCDLYELDLQTGWDNALLSYQVLKARKMPKLKLQRKMSDD